MEKLVYVKLIFITLGSIFWIWIGSITLDAYDGVPEEFRDALEYTKEEGFLKDSEVGEDTLLQFLTRGEAVRILVNAYYKNSECALEEYPFPDVSAEYKKEVCVAYSRGAISGYKDGFFREGDPINVAGISKVLVVLSGLQNSSDFVYYNTMADSYLRVLNKKGIFPTSIKFKSGQLRVVDLLEMIYRQKKDIRDKEYSLVLPEYDLRDGSVYINNRGIENANLDSFEIINEVFSKDAGNVYDFWGKVLYGKTLQGRSTEKADPNTFKVLLAQYDFPMTPVKMIASDKNSVYYWLPDDPFNSVYVIHGADPNSFEILSSGYYKDGTGVYMSRESGEISLLVGANPDTFKVNTYRRDKNHVYIDGRDVRYADLSTFRPLFNNFGGRGYYLDDNNVYWGGDRINGADSGSFHVIYINKGYGVYGAYGKDKSNIYFEGEVVDGVDVDSFQVLTYWYERDEDDIYAFNYITSQRKEIKNAHSDTFEILRDGYAKDRDRVYYSDAYDSWVVEGADPETFEVTSTAHAKDANHKYKWGRRV